MGCDLNKVDIQGATFTEESGDIPSRETRKNVGSKPWAHTHAA